MSSRKDQLRHKIRLASEASTVADIIPLLDSAVIFAEEIADAGDTLTKLKEARTLLGEDKKKESCEILSSLLEG